MNINEQLTLIYENQILKRTGPKTVDRGDISNFIYQHTDGGREIFTIESIRENDSRTNPNKVVGMKMTITGVYGSCSATRKQSQYHVPELNARNQYNKNNVLRMCVTSVDGQNYLRLPPAQRTRSFKVNNIRKIVIAGETYNVT